MDVLKGKIARELATLEERLDQELERAFGTALGGRMDRFRPAMDVYEAEDCIFVHVELAGVRIEDVRLIVDGEYLQVGGRRAPLFERAPRRHLQMEIPQGHFERVIRLRTSYDPDRVTASLVDGVLTVRLPLSPTVARTIPVTSR